jgi:serine/threonine-protein kinase
MSPEQARGVRAVDHRADLWSLAIVTFQCVTGRLPFMSEALGDLLLQIIMNPIPLPSHFNPSIAQTFDAWWVHAAQRDPALRFQSAKEFADALTVACGVSLDPRMQASAPGTLALPSMPGGGFTPPPMAPPIGMTPGGQTPNPAYASHPSLSGAMASPYQGMPVGMMGTSSGQHSAPAVTTGGVVASAAVMGAPARPKSNAALVIALSACALLALLGGGAFFLLRERGTSAAATTSPVEPTSTAAATAAPSAVEPPAPAEAPPAPSESAAASATAAASASAAPAVATNRPGGAIGGLRGPRVPPTGGGVPRPPSKGPKDFGF